MSLTLWAKPASKKKRAEQRRSKSAGRSGDACRASKTCAQRRPAWSAQHVMQPSIIIIIIPYRSEPYVIGASESVVSHVHRHAHTIGKSRIWTIAKWRFWQFREISQVLSFSYFLLYCHQSTSLYLSLSSWISIIVSIGWSAAEK